MDLRSEIEVGRSVELEIGDLAYGGEGVGRLGAVPVFVPDVCPGERVAVRIVEVQKRYARGLVTDLLQPGPERIAPVCPLHGTCGGCGLQHLDYPAQVVAKTHAVKELLARVGHLPEVPVAETVPSPLAIGYRNKVELECRHRAGGGIELCYHQREPAELVAVDFCPLALPEVNALIEGVAAWLSEGDWPAYEPETGEGLIREVGLRYATSTREANLMLITGRRELPDKQPRLRELRQAFPQLVGIRHVARTRASQRPHGREVGDLIGRALRFRVGALSLRVSPECFFQVNDGLVEPLIDAVRDALKPDSSDHLADLYGGVGTFGLSLAGECDRVSLLEIDPAAVHDARANVEHNGLTNVEPLRAQVEQRLAAVHGARRLDKVVVDPPRRGLSEGVIGLLARLKPARIAYVSCDPSTLARDLRRFADSGYQILGVQPFDLFPQSPHIEAVATLARG